MDSHNLIFTPKKRIKQNVLLHSTDKGMAFDKFMLLKNAADLAKEKGIAQKDMNLATLSIGLVKTVFETHGEHGLFQLMLLSMSTNEFDFKHFTSVQEGLPLANALSASKPIEYLELDNALLPQSSKLNEFNHHIIQPSLSSKLFRTGVHKGSFVYGFGGPRILISHPFKGIKKDIYKMYENTIDVVTSLVMRGYRGTFHFLDYLGGLDDEINEVPKWALWFSIIASHSDLVIFIKQHAGDFGPSQKLEIGLTPDRVHKKIVEIPHGELKWANDPEVEDDIPQIIIGKKGVITEEEWNTIESSHSAPLIKHYVDQSFPRDQLFTIVGKGEVHKYPLNYPVYG